MSSSDLRPSVDLKAHLFFTPYRFLLAILLEYRYEWGYGTDVDETMAEHFYRKAIALAEQDQSAVSAEKAEPASVYFVGALLKLHTRQRLRESWATAAGLQGRLEEFWVETVVPTLVDQGLQPKADFEVQAASLADWPQQIRFSSISQR